MLGRRKSLIHEKAILPWMLNDKPVTCFWSEFSDWQCNGVILFSARKIEDCDHLRNYSTNDRCFSPWKMCGHVDVISHLLEKEHENTVIRLKKLWWSCGRCKQEPWCDQYVCWCCSSHHFSFSSRKVNLFSILVSIPYHNPGIWGWSTIYRVPDTSCFRLEELFTFCQFTKLSGQRVITVSAADTGLHMLCLLVVCKVIFQSGIIWILCGNSSLVHLVCDSISGSWHQVSREAGCSKGSVRLIKQSQ